MSNRSLTADNLDLSRSLDAAVCGLIAERELSAILAKLVRCPSVTGDEREFAECIARILDREGLEPELTEATPGRPNVLGTYGPEDAPSLLLTGHTDTVPVGAGWTRDPFGAEVEGGRMFGRGTADMKGGLAAMLLVLIALARVRPEVRAAVQFAGCVDEEVGGQGTRSLLANRVNARAAVVGEPTSLKPVVSARGNSYMSVAVHGRAAHAGAPALGVNAIYGAADLIRAIQAHQGMLSRRSHPLLGHPSISVGTITGGESASIVPARCDLQLDRRLLPGESAQNALHELRAALVEECGDSGCRFDVAITMELPALETAADHPLTAMLADCASRVGVADPTPCGWIASCDGGLIAEAWRIPTVLFGPGSIERQAHRPDEHVELREVELAARIYALLSARFLVDPQVFDEPTREPSLASH